MKNKLQTPILSTMAKDISKHIQMSYFTGGIANTKPEPKPIALIKVFEMVKSSEPLKELTEQYRQTKDRRIKLSLPYITHAGVFSTREQKGLVLPSNVHVIDIDDVPQGTTIHPDSGEEIDYVELLKYRLMNDSELYSLAAMRSPSGNGVKAFIWQPAPNSVPHIDAYQEIHKSLDAYIKHTHTRPIGGKVDTQCFDISRATLLCHDQNILTIEDIEREKSSDQEIRTIQ